MDKTRKLFKLSPGCWSKEPPSGTVLSAEPVQLAVFVYTVLPRHFWAEFAPVSPLLGYCRQNKTKIVPIATPKSRAPERT